MGAGWLRRPRTYWTALSNGYYLFFLAVPVALLIGVEAARHRRDCRWLVSRAGGLALAALAIGAALVASVHLSWYGTTTGSAATGTKRRRSRRRRRHLRPSRAPRACGRTCCQPGRGNGSCFRASRSPPLPLWGWWSDCGTRMDPSTLRSRSWRAFSPSAPRQISAGGDSRRPVRLASGRTPCPVSTGFGCRAVRHGSVSGMAVCGDCSLCLVRWKSHVGRWIAVAMVTALAIAEGSTLPVRLFPRPEMAVEEVAYRWLANGGPGSRRVGRR